MKWKYIVQYKNPILELNHCKNIDAKEELKKVEDEIDLAVAELYGISKEELEGFKELMNILSGK
ncbi:MAG: hypothetical protein RXQ93_07930 [Caldisphaera sp.]